MNSFYDDFSLYIHIPFCASKCAYCDFLSFADRSAMGDYFAALCSEIRDKGRKDRVVKNIYVGGGTPSLAYMHFSDLKKALFDSFNIDPNAEISMEANPESVNDAFVYAAKTFGVNRVSVGVQSLSDPLLRRIGRAHDRKTALYALDLLLRSFPSVGADVIVGLPNESSADVRGTIQTLVNLPISHLSCYGLILERGTSLFREARRGEFSLDEDAAADSYDLACEILSKNGFDRYEISNFARNAQVCRYNTSVWEYADYLGLGLGASSFMKNEGGFPAKRTRNSRDLSRYIQTAGKARPFTRIISREEGKKEFIMLGLRLADGLDRARYRALFGCDFPIEHSEKIARLPDCLAISNEKIAIKPEYLYVSNSIISEFI